MPVMLSHEGGAVDLRYDCKKKMRQLWVSFAYPGSIDLVNEDWKCIMMTMSFSSEDDPEVLSTTIRLPPGTHHLKFIVNGEMRTTNDLPTAVDFTNVLVNYIEVSPEDMPTSRRESERGARAVRQPLHPPLIWREDEGKES